MRNKILLSETKQKAYEIIVKQKAYETMVITEMTRLATPFFFPILLYIIEQSTLKIKIKKKNPSRKYFSAKNKTYEFMYNQVKYAQNLKIDEKNPPGNSKKSFFL